MRYNKYWIIGSALVFLIIGLYSGERVFFMGFAITVSLILYSIMTSLWVLYDFNYLQSLIPSVITKGSKATLRIELHNDKPFIFPYIKLYYQTPENVILGSFKEWVTYVFPFANHKIEEEFICGLRGQYALGIVKVEVKDLFGFFTFSMNLTEQYYHKQLLLTVHPRVLLLSALPLPQLHLEGVLNKEFSSVEEPASIADLRLYRFADPLKKIHWKVSAKLQEIYVKNYETNAQPQIFVLMETCPSSGDVMTRFMIEDQIVECTTAIAHYVLSKSLPLNLVIYQQNRQHLSGREPQDFERFYGFLSSIPFDSSFTISDVLEMESASLSHSGSLLLVIHHMTGSIFNHLCIMKQSSVHPILFLVQPPDLNNIDSMKMLRELNEKGIPSFLIRTNERLDEVMEVIL